MFGELFTRMSRVAMSERCVTSWPECGGRSAEWRLMSQPTFAAEPSGWCSHANVSAREAMMVPNL